ncbi:hypothetical protein [Arthrobacter sp. ISL-28]|uniref:hypothetical protein n=1 Tax=Arthrobacter sp. ISL-28 TaxID=2819108 RepID=UPI001BE9563C|nr:hypothetical protein [Arthrobacter sp. ISL-28]MBT2519767.1 hypothetical protein [Arthrobacter sp. ISL-28]
MVHGVSGHVRQNHKRVISDDEVAAKIEFIGNTGPLRMRERKFLAGKSVTGSGTSFASGGDGKIGSSG